MCRIPTYARPYPSTRSYASPEEYGILYGLEIERGGYGIWGDGQTDDEGAGNVTDFNVMVWKRRKACTVEETFSVQRICNVMCRPIVKYSLYTEKHCENSCQCHSVCTKMISVTGLHNDNKYLMDIIGMKVCWSATLIHLVNCTYQQLIFSDVEYNFCSFKVKVQYLSFYLRFSAHIHVIWNKIRPLTDITIPPLGT